MMHSRAAFMRKRFHAIGIGLVARLIKIERINVDGALWLTARRSRWLNEAPFRRCPADGASAA
jgi:hypothetical protein